MQIIEHKLDEITLKYPLENIAPLKDILFLDIETTGFTAKNSKLYLIGCVYYKEDSFNTIQFFAEDYSDEKELLDEFFKFMKDFKVIIQFNGNNFDIPYILGKCAEFNLEYNFDTCVGIDLYKRISPYKAFLKLENCKQKTIEKFLKIDREDIYSGGDLIGIYNEYVADNKKKKALQKEYTEIAKTNGKASDCIMCRGCDGVCEQHLPTTYLRWVASVFK